MRPSAKPVRHAGVLFATAVLAAGLLHLRGSAHPGAARVTWTGGVARVLETNCVVCHGERGVARPRLDAYEPARRAAQAIKRAVLARHTPGWHAVSGFGDFANDPGLTAHEIELLAQWADALAPEGDAIARGFVPARAVEEPARPGRDPARLSLPCGTTRLRRSIDALAIRPIPGSSAWSLAVYATRPGGGVEPLGRFHDYRDSAQTYRFRRAVGLPRGTTVHVGATHGTCGAELEYVPSDGTRDDHARRPTTDNDSRAVGGASPSASGSGYWCPMHAAVRAAAPGACPQCGMRLVPMAPAVEGTYGLDVEWLPRRGAEGALRLLVREPRTAAIVRRFETLHERVFHLFVISDDLQEFSHVHPVPQPDGSFGLSSLRLGSGPYQLFADFLPAGGTPQLIRRTILPARLPAGFSGSPTPHLARETGDKTDAGLRVRMEPVRGTLVAGASSLIAFHFADAASGAPVADLEPYLGAWGHAFIVSADLADAVHSHPLTPVTAPGGPTIYFEQRFPRAGVYRLWAQFMRSGRVATVSFTVEVAEPGSSR